MIKETPGFVAVPAAVVDELQALLGYEQVITAEAEVETLSKDCYWYSPVLKARLDHAVGLWQRGLAPHLVLTGGVGEGDVMSEAAASRRYVMKLGVPDSALVLEHEGRTTRESLRNAAMLLRAKGWTRVILVSDPFHMLRLRVLASRYGLSPRLSPTRTSPISTHITSALGYAFSESIKAPLAFIFEQGLD